MTELALRKTLLATTAGVSFTCDSQRRLVII